MNSCEVFNKIINSFKNYYSIKLTKKVENSLAEKLTDKLTKENVDTKSVSDVVEPFCAEAVFNAHTEQYFLVKAAKLSESDSNEFVFFHVSEKLDEETLDKIENIAWETGLSRVNPYFGHRNSDVTLVIISDCIEEKLFKKIKRINHYKSYCFTFKGWSRFRIIAQESSSGKIACNRFATDLKKIFPR